MVLESSPMVKLLPSNLAGSPSTLMSVDLSDRTQQLWPLAYARSYFNWEEDKCWELAGNKGWKKQFALWEFLDSKGRGNEFYHLPNHVIRQEWFHSSGLPTRYCPNFFENLRGSLFDFGCGTAEMARRSWIDRYETTFLLEQTGPNLTYLKRKFYGYNVMFCDRIPQNYDGFLCMDVLEHIHNPMDTVKALWEHLKPGGMAVIWFDHTYPAAGHFKESIDQIPAYKTWMKKHTHILHAGSLNEESLVRYDWLAKPKHWWSGWTQRLCS